MTEKELKMLKSLHTVIEIDHKFLDNEQYEAYNELVDKAARENVVW